MPSSVLSYFAHVPRGCLIRQSIRENIIHQGSLLFDAFFAGSSLKLQVIHDDKQVVFYVNEESTFIYTEKPWFYSTLHHAPLMGWTNFTLKLYHDLRLEGSFQNELIANFTPSGYQLMNPNLNTSVLINGMPLIYECKTSGPTLDLSKNREMEILVGVPDWQHRFTVHSTNTFCFQLFISDHEEYICGGVGDMEFTIIFNFGYLQEHQLILPEGRKVFTVSERYTDANNSTTISFKGVPGRLLVTYNLPWKESGSAPSQGVTSTTPAAETQYSDGFESGTSLISYLLLPLIGLCVCIAIVTLTYYSVKIIKLHSFYKNIFDIMHTNQRKVLSPPQRLISQSGRGFSGMASPSNPKEYSVKEEETCESLKYFPTGKVLYQNQKELVDNYNWRDEDNIYDNDNELLYILSRNQHVLRGERQLESSENEDHIYEEIPELICGKSNIRFHKHDKPLSNSVGLSKGDEMKLENTILEKESIYVDMSKKVLNVLVHQVDDSYENPGEI
ncbi:hypothetical protein SK128_005584 [Halocaridina rubra]|uniref:Uncharacterized protein n=1 Tax=Halocaridina rubra TaxID=373956 RepID=A0AAN9AH60_HALRR